MLRLASILAILIVFQAIGGAGAPPSAPGERVRAYTREIEFDFISWTLDAVSLKLRQAALGAEKYLDEGAQNQLTRDYIDLVGHIQSDEGQLTILHSNPDATSVQDQIKATKNELDGLYARRQQTAPLAESILQSQVSYVLTEEGLTSGGQPLPPLLFHGTPLPWALIVSPRTSISQLANLSLETDLPLDEQINLEDQVASALDVSTLVVPVGGVGTYPTMVAQTSSLNWLAEVISHEWTHNFLTWHPLGVLYFQSPELTTMNETAANIVGGETGRALIAHFYPDLVPPPPPPAADSHPEDEATSSAPPVFDFRAEMHETRVHVDALLAAGKVTEAEAYMESRRLVFWNNGYAIRKLNQAYFAFYGSYADTPIGPAGEDPVGAAVRELRARSSSLAEFVQRMAPLTSFADLQALLASLD
jgi:hypothetical protein